MSPKERAKRIREAMEAGSPLLAILITGAVARVERMETSREIREARERLRAEALRLRMMEAEARAVAEPLMDLIRYVRLRGWKE